MRTISKILLLSSVILLTSCAETSPHVNECITSDPCGFWSGLLHGIIAPFSFVGSSFNDNISVYSYDNSGGWYDFGFLLGVGAFASSSTKTK